MSADRSRPSRRLADPGGAFVLRRAVGLAAVAAGLGAGTAGADGLDAVVVSVTRDEERAFDAPASIQAVGAETIRGAGPQVNLSEALSRVPGVSVLNRQNYAQDLQLSIRGFGARSTFGIRGVRLLVDGIPATMPDGQGQASTIALPSAGRIEVLRGPLAQLYGNAAGGVVQVFTADAPAAPFGLASLDAGSAGTLRSGLQAGGQFGAVNALVDASTFHTDGARVNSAARREQLNARFRAELSEATRLTLVANLHDSPWSQDPGGLTRAQLASDPRQAGTNTVAQAAGKAVLQNQLGAVLEHRQDAERQWRARLYYGERTLENRLSIPPAAQAPATSAGGVVAFDRAFWGIGLQVTQRLRTGAAGALFATAGIDLDQAVEDRRGFLNTGGVPGALRRDETDRVGNLDLYGQLRWVVDPRWSIVAGVRSSQVRFRIDDRYLSPGNADDSGSVAYRRTSPVAGVTWSPLETLNLYANLGQGFETPTFNELFYRTGGGGPNLGLRASTSRHAEIGAKARLGEGQRLDVALFDARTRDEIVVDQNVGGRSSFRNAGRTERRGVELAWAARWSPEWSSWLAITWLQASFLDAFTGGGGLPVRAGNRLPGVPDRMAFAELAWRPGWGAPWGLVAAIEAVHVGRLFVNDANGDSAPPATTANLRLGLQQRVGGWTLRQTLRVNNVADRDTVGSVIVNESSQRFFEPAPGRQWFAGVSASFAWR